MASAVVVARQFDDTDQQRRASDLGMWVFLATEVLFFGALFVAYTATRVHDPAAFEIASRLTNVTLGSINTGVLLTSSLVMALAVRSAKLGLRRASIVFMGATIVLGIAFLAIKGTEYWLDYAGHLVPAINFSHPGAMNATRAMSVARSPALRSTIECGPARIAASRRRPGFALRIIACRRVVPPLVDCARHHLRTRLVRESGRAQAPASRRGPLRRDRA